MFWICVVIWPEKGKKNELNGLISELLSEIQKPATIKIPGVFVFYSKLISLFIMLHWMLEDDASWTFQTIKSATKMYIWVAYWAGKP